MAEILNIPEKSSDSSMLPLAMMMGGGGMGMQWMWPMFMMWMMYRNGGMFGNGFGGYGWGGNGLASIAGTGYLSNQISNTEGRDLIMQAIQGRKDATDTLASFFNTSVEGIKQSLQQFALSGKDFIAAVTQGNMQLAKQISDEAGASRLQACQNASATKEAICDAKTDLAKALTMLGFQAERDACGIKETIRDQTDRVIAGQNAAEKRELLDKIDALREENSTYKMAGIMNQQVAPINNAIAGLKEQFAAFAAKQPTTYPVQYQPFVAVPNAVYAAGVAANGGTGFWGQAS